MKVAMIKLLKFLMLFRMNLDKDGICCFLYNKICNSIWYENINPMCNLQKGNFVSFYESNHKTKNLIQLKSFCRFWVSDWCLLLNWLVITVIYSVSIRSKFDFLEIKKITITTNQFSSKHQIEAQNLQELFN